MGESGPFSHPQVELEMTVTVINDYHFYYYSSYDITLLSMIIIVVIFLL